MEDLEKEKCSCGCCEECTCGDNCTCTEDDKCCESCTCGENEEHKCKCEHHDCGETESENINNNCDCDEQCECEEECTCDESCDCVEDCSCSESCDCGSDCDCNEENKCNEHCTCSHENNQDCGGGEGCTCGENCECTQENKCNENCTCGQQNVNEDKTQHGTTEVEDEQCKCGCGENVNENLSDAYFKRLLSLQAEFDNYRKRTQNEMSKAYQNGFNEAITEFLPALDSFKMATEYITDPNTLVGIQYIEKGILATLEKMGVKVIDVSGKFDPNFHQAIGSEVSPGHESGDIIKECFKGFILGDKVIRYSQVIVAK